MKFRENADVITSKGDKVGRVNKVVVDPSTEEVTHLVVKKGLFLTRDRVVPLDQVQSATEDLVVLRDDVEDPDSFPNFEETRYVPAAGIEEFQCWEAWEARKVILYHTRINMPWWKDGPDINPPKPPFVKTTRRNIPEGTVPLEEGAKVMDAEGNPVGNIAEIYAEPEEHRITHLLIERGILGKEKKLIPSAWVKDIFEDSVRLSVRSSVIENLPEPVSG